MYVNVHCHFTVKKRKTILGEELITNAFAKWGLLLFFLKIHYCFCRLNRVNYTYSEGGPQTSHVCQVGQFIWGTVGEHPVPLQAVSHRECLLISLAIKLGQWWMVCVPLPWPGMCCDTHWPAAAVVLAALLRVSPVTSAIHHPGWYLWLFGQLLAWWIVGIDLSFLARPSQCSLPISLNSSFLSWGPLLWLFQIMHLLPSPIYRICAFQYS